MGTFKQTYVKDIAFIFAVISNGVDNFCNQLRSRMYYRNHRPPMNGRENLTNVNSLHLLAVSMNYAANKGWISQGIKAQAVTSFRNKDFHGGAEQIADSLQAISIVANLNALQSVVAGIQTGIITLPASGPVAWLFNGESVGSAAITKYTQCSTNKAVDDFIQVLRRAAH